MTLHPSSRIPGKPAAAPRLRSESESPLAAAYIAPYKDSKVVDEYTLEVHLAYAYTPFLYNLAQSWLAILSPKAIKESPETLCDKPIASGPFVLEKYQRQQSITYVRRPTTTWHRPG